MPLRIHWLFLVVFGLGYIVALTFDQLNKPEMTLPSVQAQALATENLLVNPGFEEGYTRWQNASEVNVAAGWVPWWHQGTPTETSEGYFRRPEYTAELAEDIRNGNVYRYGTWFFHGEKAQRYFTSFSTHDAGLYQQVAVPQGSWLEFSAWVRVHSSDCDDPCVSPLAPCHPWINNNSNGDYRVAIGIDPFGRKPAELGFDPPATVDQPIHWSPLEIPVRYDTWLRLRVFAQAQSDHVTVYLRGNPVYRVKDNTIYWDEASLRVLPGTPEPTETPTSTLTPRPTHTPSVTPTSSATRPRDRQSYLPYLARNWLGPISFPTDTPSPTPTHSATPTPTLTGTPLPTPTSSASFTLTPTPTATATELPATETPSPSPTSSATFTPTSVATDTLTATPTQSGSPPDCTDLIINGDFEAEGGWTLLTTAQPAAFSSAYAFQGVRSLRLGTEVAGDDVEGWSIAGQTRVIPADAVSVTVQFAYYSLTQDDTGDWQAVLLRTGNGVPVKLLLWLAGPNAGTNGWRTQTVHLAPDLLARLAGSPVELYLELYNDGDGRPTALYVDAMALIACRSRGGFSAQDAAPPGTDIRIRYPIRYEPGQVNFNMPGTCNEVEFESIQLENVGVIAVDMSGWTLTEVRAGNVFTFPNGINFLPNARLRLWTQPGSPSLTDLYWGRTEPVWDNSSDEAILRDTAGTEIARRGYP